MEDALDHITVTREISSSTTRDVWHREEYKGQDCGEAERAFARCWVPYAGAHEAQHRPLVQVDWHSGLQIKIKRTTWQGVVDECQVDAPGLPSATSEADQLRADLQSAIQAKERAESEAERYKRAYESLHLEMRTSMGDIAAAQQKVTDQLMKRGRIR